jgi:dTDP-4-amino-4,6-dideoxygalactose transaminase
MVNLLTKRSFFLDGHTMTPSVFQVAINQLQAPSLLTHDLLQALARFQQTAYVGLTGSGRAALWCLLKATGLPRGTQVLMPGFTCIAVVNAVVAAGFKPFFYDIETDTYGPDPTDLKEKLHAHPQVRIVIIHHLFGLVSKNYESCVAMAKTAGCWVIEDLAQSFGARFKGRRIGHLGDAAFTSFEQSKQLSTYRGGAFFTNNATSAQAAQTACDSLPRLSPDEQKQCLQRWFSYYHMQRQSKTMWCYYLRAIAAQRRYPTQKETTVFPNEPLSVHHGFSTFAGIMAPVALAQLANLDAAAQQKRSNWPEIERIAASLQATLPQIIESSEPSWLRVPLRIEDIREAAKILQKQGHQTGFWFMTPLHPTTIPVVDCPNAAATAGHLVNIGFRWPHLR